MRILLVAEDGPGSIGQYCRKALTDLGHEVGVFRYRTEYQVRARLSKVALIRKVEKWALLRPVNAGLVKAAAAFRPEIVLVIKGELLLPSALDRVRGECNAVLVNWNPDSPFNPTNSTPYLLTTLPVYDCHFCWGRFLIPRFLEAGAKRAEYLAFAYDPGVHKRMGLIPEERSRLGAQVTFAGTWDKPRELILAELVDHDLAIWGNHWDRVGPGSPLRRCWRGPAVYGEELSRVYAASTIVLNLVREQNGSAHNMRTFEGPACGAFMLATRTEEQCQLFGDGVGIATFSSMQELRDQIDHYLHHSDVREQIAERGYQVVHGQHTYRHRMDQLVQTAGEMVASRGRGG